MLGFIALGEWWLRRTATISYPGRLTVHWCCKSALLGAITRRWPAYERYCWREQEFGQGSGTQWPSLVKGIMGLLIYQQMQADKILV